MKILNFGSLNIDYVYKVKNFVSPGETVKSKELVRKVGGKGLNQSVAMARAGLKVYHAGCVGEDGRTLVDFLKKDNINTENIKFLNIPTGHAIIQVDEKGENCILLFGGANQSISEDFADEVLKSFSEGDYIVLQNETNITPYLMEKAYQKGLKIIFNPSPITDNILSFPLEKVSLFILNEVEGEALTGEKEETKIIKKLQSLYPSAEFVLTLGEKGAVYFGEEKQFSVDAEKVEVVDTTAAGDTFTGYFIANKAKGKSVEESLLLATKAAAKAVTVLGAAESIPNM